MKTHAQFQTQILSYCFLKYKGKIEGLLKYMDWVILIKMKIWEPWIWNELILNQFHYHQDFGALTGQNHLLQNSILNMITSSWLCRISQNMLYLSCSFINLCYQTMKPFGKINSKMLEILKTCLNQGKTISQYNYMIKYNSTATVK